MSQQPPEEPLPEESNVEEQQPNLDEEPQPSLDEEPQEYLSGTLVGRMRRATGGLGGLGTGLFGGGLVAVVLGGVIFLAVSDIRLYAAIIMGVGAGLLLLGMITSWPSVQSAMGARRGRYGVNTVVMVVAFLGIAAVANFLAFEYSSRMDVTATNQFSLAARTKELLKELKEPVKVRAFFQGDDPNQQVLLTTVEDTLREFDARSGKFSYDIIDPDRNPDVANAYNVRAYPSVVFEGQDSKRTHHVELSPFLEQDFVTGLLIVTGEQQKKIYFLTNHGERDIEDLEPSSKTGFGFAAFDGLRGENYQVETLNLLRDPVVPDDATMVVIAGPSRDMADTEIPALDNYLRGGGLLLFLAEPNTPETFRDFLKRWGVEVRPGYVRDEERNRSEVPRTVAVYSDQFIQLSNTLLAVLQGHYGESGAQAIASFADSLLDVTSPLDGTFHPGVASLRPAEGVAYYPRFDVPPEGAQPKPLGNAVASAMAISSSQSWLIDDLRREERQEDDPRGPFFTAMAVSAVAPVGEELPQDRSQLNVASIVVIGDADFATNENFYAAPWNNSDLFLNSINWLAGDVALISIRPKPFVFRELRLDRNQRNFVRYTSWLLMPSAMLLMAGVVWWRRR